MKSQVLPLARPPVVDKNDRVSAQLRGSGGRLALYVAAVAAVSFLAACSRPAPAPEPVRAVKTQVVSLRGATSSADYAGEVKARVESRLSFRVGGKLIQRSVDLGQPVRAGQLLAQLDPSDLRLGQVSAQAGLAAAQANFEQTEADTQRYRDLRAQGFISAAELERRETALKAARSTLEQARAQNGVQSNQTTYARLVADVAGVVTGVDAEPGMVVAAGTPVVRIAQDGPRDVVFNVPEDRVTALRALIGRKDGLQVKLWGQTETVPGTLRELAAAADPATRTFLAKADIGRADVRLGQTATVVVAGTAPAGAEAIAVPLAALSEQGGRSQVWVLDPASMTVSPQAVQVVSADGQSVLIGQGLQPGQEVVIAGVHVLTPKQVVKRYGVSAAAAAASSSASAAR
jgi:RND family efflux transporter MFP subunit